MDHPEFGSHESHSGHLQGRPEKSEPLRFREGFHLYT